MGQSATTPNRDRDHLASIYHFVAEQPETGIIFLDRKDNGQGYLLREHTYNEQTEFQSNWSRLKQRQSMQSEHLTNLQQLEQRAEDNICSSFYKIYAIWDYPKKSLAEQLRNRTDRRADFAESELWSIMASSILGMNDLQRANLKHDAVSAKTILLAPDGVVKLADPSTGSYRTNAETISLNRNQPNIYLSPEQCKSLQTTGYANSQNSYKSDVFSLGMIVLHCGLLQSQDGCYRQQKQIISRQEIERNLSMFEQKYSGELRMMLELMLQEDSRLRPEWTELEKCIKKEAQNQIQAPSVQQMSKMIYQMPSQSEFSLRQPSQYEPLITLQTNNPPEMPGRLATNPINPPMEPISTIQMQPFSIPSSPLSQQPPSARFGNTQIHQTQQIQIGRSPTLIGGQFQQNTQFITQSPQGAFQGSQIYQEPLRNGISFANTPNQSAYFAGLPPKSQFVQRPQFIQIQPQIQQPPRSQIVQGPFKSPSFYSTNLNGAPGVVEYQKVSDHPYTKTMSFVDPTQISRPLNLASGSREQIQMQQQPSEIHRVVINQPQRHNILQQNSPSRFGPYIQPNGIPQQPHMTNTFQTISSQGGFYRQPINLHSTNSTLQYSNDQSKLTPVLNSGPINLALTEQRTMATNIYNSRPELQGRLQTADNYGFNQQQQSGQRVLYQNGGVLGSAPPQYGRILAPNAAPEESFSAYSYTESFSKPKQTLARSGVKAQQIVAIQQPQYTVIAVNQNYPAMHASGRSDGQNMQVNVNEQPFTESRQNFISTQNKHSLNSNSSSFGVNNQTAQSRTQAVNGAASISHDGTYQMPTYQVESLSSSARQFTRPPQTDSFNFRTAGNFMNTSNAGTLNVSQPFTAANTSAQNSREIQGGQIVQDHPRQIQNMSESQRLANSSDHPEYVVQIFVQGGRYEGMKVKNLREGPGKFYYQAGGMYDGSWHQNKMHGVGSLYYQSGNLAYEGSWHNDQFQGQGKLFNDNSAKLNQPFDYSNFDMLEEYWQHYQGNFHQDVKQGLGKLVLSNGEYYLGSFDQDLVHGQGKFHRINGEVFSGVWDNNVLVTEAERKQI